MFMILLARNRLEIFNKYKGKCKENFKINVLKNRFQIVIKLFVQGLLCI